MHRTVLCVLSSIIRVHEHYFSVGCGAGGVSLHMLRWEWVCWAYLVLSVQGWVGDGVVSGHTAQPSLTMPTLFTLARALGDYC